MIKSEEEFKKVIEQFGGEDYEYYIHSNQNITKDFLTYLKDGHLKRIIEIWNSEKDNITNPEDLMKARHFAWRLRSTRRLLLDEFNLDENSIPFVESSEILNKRIEHFKLHSLKIKRGDTFLCIKDFIYKDTILYKKDKIYISDIDNCITNELMEADDEWTTYLPEFLLHFKVCENPGIEPHELTKIKSGDKFRCLKDFSDSITGEIIFFQDNIYEAKHKNSLYNKSNWEIKFDKMIFSEFQKYFEKI